LKRTQIIGIALLFVALIVGGLAAYMTDQYIEQRKEAFRAELRSQYELAPVVVPGTDLSPGDNIQKRNMLVRQIPRKFLTDNAVQPDDFSQVAERQVRVPISRGTPLVTSFVGKPGRSGFRSFSARIPEDMRAITIGVSGTAAMSGLLVPGDNVDLVLKTVGPEGRVQIPLLGDVEILATGSNVSADARQGDSGSYRSVTLKVTEEQARRIKAAQEMGSLVVTLRNPDDRDDMLQQATTKKGVFGERYDDLIGPAKKQNTQGPTVEIIQGASAAGGDGSGPAMGGMNRQQLMQMMRGGGGNAGGLQ